MELFSVFPIVEYNGYNLKNILTKIAPIRENFSKYEVYYPYTIRDGERPDTIAYDYYGSSQYAWLVMIANDIYDPYRQWPYSYRQFYDYLLKKYGEVETLKDNISHYEYTGIGGIDTQEDIDRITWVKTTDTYDLDSIEEKSGWTPIYVYDYEFQLNENKRSIRLLSNQYKKQVDREINALINGIN